MVPTANPSPELLADRPPRPPRQIPVSLWMFVTILVLLGVACACLSVSGYRQLLAIREIERLGGYVQTEPERPKWLYGHLGDHMMKMFDEVVYVHFNRQATDTALLGISKLTSIRNVWLEDTQVTDAGLAHLKGLTELGCLWLDNTHVGDAGLAHLKGLVKMEQLWLHHTQVTDTGIGELELTLPRMSINK